MLDRPIDRRLFVLGDSVILGAQASVALRLTISGWSVQQVAQESFHSYNAGPVVDEARGAIGDVAVVALGHNDAGTPGQFAFWIDELMAHLADTPQVFWVNLRNFRDFVPAANADLQAATQRWPNLRIIDWDARSTPEPGLVYDDGIHLNPFGQQAMADLIGAAVDSYAIERALGAGIEPISPW